MSRKKIFSKPFDSGHGIMYIKLPRLEEVVDFVEFSTESTGLIDSGI